jgi:hypothetical protein
MITSTSSWICHQTQIDPLKRPWRSTPAEPFQLHSSVDNHVVPAPLIPFHAVLLLLRELTSHVLVGHAPLTAVAEALLNHGVVRWLTMSPTSYAAVACTSRFPSALLVVTVHESDAVAVSSSITVASAAVPVAPLAPVAHQN